MLEDQKQDLEKEIRRMRPVRIFLVLMLVSYAIGVQLETKFNTFDPWLNFPPTLCKVVLLGLAIYSFVFAYYFRKQVVTGKGPLASNERLINRAAKLKKPVFIVRYRTAVTMSLLLSHASALYGLFLWHLTGDFLLFYILVLASLGGSILFGPKIEEIEALSHQ